MDPKRHGRAEAKAPARPASAPVVPLRRSRARPAPAGRPSDGAPAGRLRLMIENLRPRVDEGRYPAKRALGERIEILADIFTDGHDRISAVLRHRVEGEGAWAETAMEPLANDLWRASFVAQRIGFYEFTVEAWVDRFGSWATELKKKCDAGQDVRSELLEGAAMLRAAATRARGVEREWIEQQARLLESDAAPETCVELALGSELAATMTRLADRTEACLHDRVLRVRVDRERARFGAWYEMFPRSAGNDPARGATLREAEARLPEIAAMGCDIVYLPPVHPIGRTHRKGANNALTARPGDTGSPWAIGAREGGHKAVAPELGTLADFEHFVATAQEFGLEIALDIAFQCSPDHPYVREHPEWFRHRPDGSIKYAENPPKKYQDIYPFDFECEDWRGLWEELKSVVLFWVERGVEVFRVDNPHTKPFRFWEWLIAEVQCEHPGTVFLAEAFTRPKVMKALAKLGFTQSYTYFTWRNTCGELTEYLTELTQTDVRDYMRPNLFANTPDILHEYLQYGGRPAFQIRLALAATLGASYGIYGPAFELCEARAVPGTEEYQDSEKYQVRVWKRDDPAHIRDFITRVNQARRANPALQYDQRLRFHGSDNHQILFYSKSTPDLLNIVLVAVSLDPHHLQEGWVHLPLEELGIPAHEPSRCMTC